MINTATIQQQLSKLSQDKALWSKKAEEALQARNFQSLAASNADHINAMIQSLEFVLSGKPLPCVYEDNGSQYPLAVEK